jgi:hypothetical protein
MLEPGMSRDVDPAWFQPQKNQNDYTQGFFKGRDYERKRIIAILKDWDLNLRWDWVDIYRMIDEGMEYRQLTMSPALLDDYKVRAAQIEREKLFDAVKGYFDSIAPAHDADKNLAHSTIERAVLGLLAGNDA